MLSIREHNTTTHVNSKREIFLTLDSSTQLPDAYVYWCIASLFPNVNFRVSDDHDGWMPKELMAENSPRLFIAMYRDAQSLILIAQLNPKGLLDYTNNMESRRVLAQFNPTGFARLLPDITSKQLLAQINPSAFAQIYQDGESQRLLARVNPTAYGLLFPGINAI